MCNKAYVHLEVSKVLELAQKAQKRELEKIELIKKLIENDKKESFKEYEEKRRSSLIYRIFFWKKTYEQFIKINDYDLLSPTKNELKLVFAKERLEDVEHLLKMAENRSNIQTLNDKATITLTSESFNLLV